MALPKPAHRSSLSHPVPSYQPGNKVLLLSTNIDTEWPAQKLDWKKLGQFKIICAINLYSYLLDLPLD